MHAAETSSLCTYYTPGYAWLVHETQTFFLQTCLRPQSSHSEWLGTGTRLDAQKQNAIDCSSGIPEASRGVGQGGLLERPCPVPVPAPAGQFYMRARPEGRNMCTSTKQPQKKLRQSAAVPHMHAVANVQALSDDKQVLQITTGIHEHRDAVLQQAAAQLEAMIRQ